MVFCLLLCLVIVPFRSNSCLLSQVLPAIKIVAKDGVYNSSLLTALVGKYAINSSLGGGIAKDRQRFRKVFPIYIPNHGLPWV